MNISRIGDKDDDFPPNALVTGSGTVFANGIGIARISDTDDDFPPNVKIGGSANVFIGG